MDKKLVKGRECGDCQACCIALTIDEPDFNKPADIPCANLSQCGGCGIYENRPSICRVWYCAWRYLEHFSDDLRPDKSGVILRIEGKQLIIQPLYTPFETLTSQAVLELVGGGIERDIEFAISIPAADGVHNSLRAVNKKLLPSVLLSDFESLKQSMTEIINDVLICQVPV